MSLLLSCASARTSDLFCSSQKGNGRERDLKYPIPLNHSKDLNFLLKKLAPPLTAVLLAVSPICYPPESLGQTLDIQRGATLFNRACIGCHDTGGNIIQPGATLFTKDLERNRVNTDEEIYRVTYYGKGRMPGRSPSRASLYLLTFPFNLAKCSEEFICLMVHFRDLVRNAHQEDNVLLDHGCKMKKSSFWLSL